MAVIQGFLRDDGGSGSSVSNPEGQVFNVRAYLAVGDGNADDTQKIRDTIAAVPANGGIVYFPPGTYKVTGTINVTNKSIQFLGAGPLQSIIRVATDLVDIFSLLFTITDVHDKVRPVSSGTSSSMPV